MGFAFHFQFQTQARRSETGWCVVWWDAACTTCSHSTGSAAGVCSGSECFAARPSGGQVFSLSPADSIPWWWGFVESAGQIAIFFIATWWEAPYSHPQESFCSPVDAVSAFHHETCWCFHFDFRCSEKLLGVWFASHSQTSEEDVCVMPAPGLRSMYPTHGSVTRGAGESSSALCCDGSRPCGTTLLLWHSSEEILGSFVYMWCGARCAPWTGWRSLDIWHGTSISAPGGAQRSAQGDLFW